MTVDEHAIGRLALLGGKFRPGQVCSTPGAHELFASSQANPVALLRRHLRGDWGDLCDEDKKENDYAIGKYLRIFSSYKIGEHTIWCITEADRSVTTFLLPDEY